MIWKAGDKAVCIKRAKWVNVVGQEYPGPAHQEKVVIDGIGTPGFLLIATYDFLVWGLRVEYDARYFRPIVSKTLEEDRELFRKIADSAPVREEIPQVSI